MKAPVLAAVALLLTATISAATGQPPTDPLADAPQPTTAAARPASHVTSDTASVRSGQSFLRTEQREPCADYSSERQAFFGDLHVHTTYSFDAWSQGTRNTPRDAYRFARGEAVGVQPYDDQGSPLRSLRLSRPLDFSMVSDHAEMLGETHLCRTAGSTAYGAFTCLLMRRWPALGYMVVNSQWNRSTGRSQDICGDTGAVCETAALSPWQATLDAAEEFYDRSPACRFTTFVGFEWSGARVGMVHRNVVFRNTNVLAYPPNAIDDGHDEKRLWKRLQTDCLDAANGCDVLAIPHNSNLSGGSMFWTEDSAADASLDAATARLRATMEPLVEITQHKGDSECRISNQDPLCDFETLAFGDVAGHASSTQRSPVPPGVYVREGLGEGLRHALRLGVNPFAMGIIGSTDTHMGTPGAVDEDDFIGHAAGIVSARLTVPDLPDHPLFNPGGLAVLWAEENSRDALFAAMRRREAYGTSGPRIVARLFGGWDYDAALCGSQDFVERGYAGGVPMGGDLPPAPTKTAAPTFAALAMADPGTTEKPGTPLQRIQIVKGWVRGGEVHERVIDIAGATEHGNELDLTSCRPSDDGSRQLCSVWRDDDFDAAEPAYYYARVIENHSCRWSWHVCRKAAVDCDALIGPRGSLAACCDPQTPKTIQERAWTSPIFYSPRTVARPNPY